MRSLSLLCVLFLGIQDPPAWRKIKLTDKFTCEGANAVDVNKDGKLDIVAGPYWYEAPDFTGAREIYTPKAFDPLHYSDNFFAWPHDFNADGWMDVLFVGFPGKDASWFENPQGKDGHWTRHLVVKVVDNESPHFTDLTGDGKPELVFHTGGVLGWAGPPDWTFHPLSTKGNRPQFTHGLGVGDVNGDKRMDVLEKSGWWEQPASLEGDPVWKHHAFEFAGPGGAQMYAYDVDGDGDNDVITSLWAHGHGLAWYEQAEGTFKKHVIMDKAEPFKFSEIHAVDLVDIDGDGLKDIVTGKRHWSHGPKGDPDGGAPAVLYWFKLVRKDGVRWEPNRIDDDSGVGVQVLARDVNGDGKTDVIVGNKKGAFLFLQEKK